MLEATQFTLHCHYSQQLPALNNYQEMLHSTPTVFETLNTPCVNLIYLKSPCNQVNSTTFSSLPMGIRLISISISMMIITY